MGLRQLAMALSALTACSPLAAQPPVVEWAFPAPDAYEIRKTTYLGDIDDDGVGDVLAFVHFYAPITNLRETRLLFLSGRDGALLRERTEVASQQKFWGFCAAGDVNGDGAGDYAVTILPPNIGPPFSNYNIVEVCSGRDDEVLWAVEGRWGIVFGNSLYAGDFDGDGTPDLAVSAPRGGPEWRGAVYAYAHGGRLLWEQYGTADLWIGGRNRVHQLGSLGDLDGDGRADVLAACFDWHTGLTGSVVLSGLDGRVLQKGLGEPGDLLGDVHSAAGDLDGDGVLDWIAGQDNGGGREGAFAFSGATGRAIHVWRPHNKPDGGPPQQTYFGAMVAGGHDVDQDGVPDVAIGQPGFLDRVWQGLIHLYSGRDGSLMRSFRPPHLFLDLGWNFEFVGRGPARSPALLLGIEGAPLPGFGEVALWTLDPPGVQGFGVPCQGGLSGAPRIGLGTRQGRPRIHLSGAEPGAPAALLLGFSSTTWSGLGLPLSLGGVGFPGCELLVAPELVHLTRTETGSPPHAGWTYVDLPSPLAWPAPPSLPVFAQWLALDRQGLSGGATRALTFWQ